MSRGRADWVEPAYGPIPASEVMRAYEQRFAYDAGGNITEMRHLLGGTTTYDLGAQLRLPGHLEPALDRDREYGFQSRICHPRAGGQHGQSVGGRTL